MCIDNKDCVFFSIYNEEYAKNENMIKTRCYLKGINVNEKRITNRYDSGVLLNRIPDNLKNHYGYNANDVFVKGIEIEKQLIKDYPKIIENNISLDNIDINEYFEHFNSATGIYFHNLLMKKLHH